MQEKGTGTLALSDEAGIVAPSAILATLCDEAVATAIDVEPGAETVEFPLWGDSLGAPLLDERVPKV